MAKFDGSLEDLKAQVEACGGGGDWTDNDNLHRFRSHDGAVINWYKSTKTLQLQGKATAKARYSSLLGSQQPGPPALAMPARAAELGVPTADSPIGLRVFVVHGHDETAREQLELVLHKLGLQPFVLQNSGGGGLTIIEALEKETSSDACQFGIVLMTPDDMGFANSQGQEALAPRARQNVVLEMGMLIARLGRSRVAILRKGHIESPSDASGIIYLPFNEHVRETVTRLVMRLREAGFEISAEKVTAAAS